MSRMDYNLREMQEARERYVGKTFTQYMGYNATCVAYKNSSCITVVFDDGVEVITSSEKFKKGKVRRPEDKKLFTDDYIESLIGKEFINKAGRKYRIVGGLNSRRIDVQFEDGKIRKGMKSNSVFAGVITHPDERSLSRMHFDAKKRIGEVYHCGIGMSYKIIGYTLQNKKTLYKVRFDDGTEIEVYDGGQFKKGELKHPKYNGKCKEYNIDFYGFDVYEKVYSEGKLGNKYYSCKCRSCEKEYILTFDEMKEHKCKSF